MILWRTAVFTLLLAGNTAALAQGAAPGVPVSTQRAQPPRPKAWALTVGLAPIYTPVWQGSRDSALSIFPDLRLNYRDSVFLSIPDGLGWNAINRNGWKIGPVIKPRFGRNENTGGSPFLVTGGSTALIGLGTIGFAGEVGGFVQYGFGVGKTKARAEVRQGFGGHDGALADLQLSHSDRAGKFFYSIGARSTFAGAGFTNRYFGVDAAQAAASGLPVSRVGGGLVSYGLNGALVRPLNRNATLTMFSGYDRLGDVVADSSLIRQRGQRGQFSIGLAFGYRFGWD